MKYQLAYYKSNKGWTCRRFKDRAQAEKEGLRLAQDQSIERVQIEEFKRKSGQVHVWQPIQIIK